MWELASYYFQVNSHDDYGGARLANSSNKWQSCCLPAINSELDQPVVDLNLATEPSSMTNTQPANTLSCTTITTTATTKTAIGSIQVQ